MLHEREPEAGAVIVVIAESAKELEHVVLLGLWYPDSIVRDRQFK